MYVTAHRVRATTGERINAFLHLHGADFSWPRDASGLPEEEPGSLQERAEFISLPPDGNRVLSYLDLLAPDTTSHKELSAALQFLQVRRILG